MILVAGDYDEVSQSFVQEVLEAGLGVRVLVDAPATLRPFTAGAQFALHRPDVPSSSWQALDGVERLCLPVCRDDRDALLQLACLDHAAIAGIRRVVKISGEHADGPDDAHASAADRRVEHAISEGSLPWTIVRHAPTFQDLLWLGRTWGQTRPSETSIVVAAVDAGDVAMVAIDCLVDDELPPRDELVTGPAVLELHACFEALGRVPLDEYVEKRPEAPRLWRRRLGEPAGRRQAHLSDAVARVTGEMPRSLAEFVADITRPQTRSAAPS